MAFASSTQILLVTRHDPQDPLGRILRGAGYAVVAAESAPAALRSAERTSPALIVIDPRALSSASRDEVAAFADEHGIPLLSDWSDPQALLTTIRSMLGERDSVTAEAPRLTVGPLEMDVAAHLVRVDGTPLDLTAKEFDLLAHLARHPGWVYSRQELLEQVWGYEYGDPQVVTVHIANLRKKLEAASPGCKLIETVHNVGYRLAATPTTPPTPGTAAPSGPPSGWLWKRKHTRIIVGSVFAAAVILVGLGLGLGLGLGGEDETNPAFDAEAVVPADQSALVRWGPQTVTEEDEQGNVLWQATWWVYARQANNPSGRWGSEVMDWSVTLPPPTAPPLGRNETADLLSLDFERVGDASVATVIFSFDTTDWDHAGPPSEPYPPAVYHKFILTDNPGSQLDHVEAYAGRPEPDEVWALKFMDIDCAGVEIIYYPPPADEVNVGETSTTQD